MEEFRNAALNPNHPVDPHIYFSLYDTQDKVDRVCSGVIQKNKWDKGGHVSWKVVRVKWHDSYIFEHHLKTLHEMDYEEDHLIATYSKDPGDEDGMPILLRRKVSDKNRVIKVSWKEREEDMEYMQEREGIERWSRLQTDYDQQCRRDNPTRVDYDKELGEEEGNNFTPSYYPSLKDRVKLSHKPINPDMDIKPTGKIEIQEGSVNTQDLWMYDSKEGRYQGSMDKDIYKDLYNRIHPCYTEEDKRSRIMQVINSSCRNNSKVSKGPSKELMQAICTLKMSTSYVSKSTQYKDREMEYLSNEEGDKELGSKGLCYGSIWEGRGIAYIEEGDKDIDKAMRWAIGSAILSKEPTVTLLFVLDQAGTNCK